MLMIIVDNDNALPTVKLKWLYKALASASTETAPALLAVAPVSVWSALITVVAPEVY